MKVYIVSSQYGIEICVEKIFFSESKAMKYLNEQEKKYPSLIWNIDEYDVED